MGSAHPKAAGFGICYKRPVSRPGKVYLVGAGPGDPGLITVRGQELLQRADAVLYDALSHPGILAHCRDDADVRNVGKRGGSISPSQDWITDQLIELARAGKEVVRLKGGDSFLFARGAEEAEALAEAGIPFEVVPGLSSPVGTSAYAGIPLTHREFSSSVTFITGTDRNGQSRSDEAWRKLATATDTICVLMGMRKLDEIAQAVIAGGRDPATPAAVIHWGARPEQRVVTATLADIAEAVRREGVSNPAVIVIGEVVALRDKLSWYDSLPAFGKRILVPRPPHQAGATAKAIRSRGAEPVLFPVIRIDDPPDSAPIEKAVDELATYDWVLFTSANGVERFFEVLRRRGLDARALGAAKVGVIGPKTKLALQPFGIEADLVAKEFVGEGLAEELARWATPKRILIPRALVAREELPLALCAAGAHVDVVPVYQTLGIEPERATTLANMLRDGALDVVMFTSSSTVDNTCDALGQQAPSVLGNVTVASIGPITTASLQSRGIAVDVTASVYTVDGLLDALDDHFTAKQP